MSRSMNHKDFVFEVKAIEANGTFSGYGSVYGVVDDGEDIVDPGCFTESLADWASKGRMPALLWQHSSRDPIGAYTAMKEDANGLFVEGKLALKTQRGAEAYELMQMKAISGLSIGFMTREDSYDQKTGVRTIKKADLWECSVVTFPMNDQARISAVKTIEEIGDLNGAELYLREVGGVSRSEAKAIVSRLFAIARREVGKSEDEADLKAITALLEKRQALLTA
jgi:HK97 family phage prohead protease